MYWAQLKTAIYQEWVVTTVLFSRRLLIKKNRPTRRERKGKRKAQMGRLGKQVVSASCSLVIYPKKIPNPQCPIPNPPCPIPNSQSPIPNPQSPIPNAQFPIPHALFPIPNPPFPFLKSKRSSQRTNKDIIIVLVLIGRL